RPAWSRKRSLLSLLIAALVFAAIVLWPMPKPAAPTLDALSPAPAVAALPGQPRLTEQALRVDPPGYTRLPPRSEPTLEARVPQGSNLRWTLRFQPQPASAALVFHDGLRLPLRRQGDDWIAQRSLPKSALYRIEAAGAAPAQSRRLYRLDVTPDRAPQLRVLEPDRGLTLMAQGQRAWPLVFEATDDYGLAAAAQLRITLAQGSGENITFREQRISLHGTGAAAQKRYAHRLDLAALGFAVGDDLIVQLSVDDNRNPQPQNALSPSLILRWPADLGSEATGIEGMVKTTLPAYFRSQRQIIIDAEALIAQRRKLSADEFLKRSDAIGVDQRLLRLRYGQFLGEEARTTITTTRPARRRRSSARKARCWRNTATPTITPRPRPCSIRERASCSRPRSTRCGNPNCTCARASRNRRCRMPTRRWASSSRCSRPAASIWHGSGRSCRRSTKAGAWAAIAKAWRGARMP
ncbi:MAG: hypothetical protein JF591_09985, partial [Lysobacter sp.]|nr:hypothetical protein [Lysobacter sp.]